METNSICKSSLCLLAVIVSAAALCAAPPKRSPDDPAVAPESTAARSTIPADNKTRNAPAKEQPVLPKKKTSPTPTVSALQNRRVEKSDPPTNSAAAPSPYTIDARIFISGEAARTGGEIGKTQLTEKEKELTLFLAYRDYRLLKENKQSVPVNKAVTVKFADDKSVRITPLSESSDRIKLMIEWKIPGEEENRWRKLLFFRKNYRALVGGPKIDGGGMYLLSLDIK